MMLTSQQKAQKLDPKWHKGSWQVTINCDNCYEAAQAALKEEGGIWV